MLSMCNMLVVACTTVSGTLWWAWAVAVHGAGAGPTAGPHTTCGLESVSCKLYGSAAKFDFRQCNFQCTVEWVRGRCMCMTAGAPVDSKKPGSSDAARTAGSPPPRFSFVAGMRVLAGAYFPASATAGWPARFWSESLWLGVPPHTPSAGSGAPYRVGNSRRALLSLRCAARP
jgi:hypothetical protein